MSDQIVRNKDGTFAKGFVANPQGKPVGAESKISKLRKMIADRVPEILDKLIESAINGDTQAAKLLIERALPAYRPETMPVSFQLPVNGTLKETGELVIKLMFGGEISTDQANTILNALNTQGRIIEMTDLEKRIAELERASRNEL